MMPQTSLAQNKNSARPNVLLIVSEDNGPELGCYGDPYVKTPRLDRLAEEGVRFENAFVPYSVCSPSRACFLTGLHPHQNGQIGLATHKYQMYREFPNVFTLLKANGYRTGLIGKLHVNPASAFPVDYRAIPGANFGKNQRSIEKYADKANEFFTQSDEPFFLSINYSDAHFPLHRQDHGQPEKPLDGQDVKPLPWVGADSPRLRQFTANYYNCMMRLDAGVDLLLQKLDETGKLNNTLIIYIGDHGAQFSRGKVSVYESGLRIPFIVNWPGRILQGTVSKKLVSTIDILPTILSATGAAGPQTYKLPGRNLTPLLQGDENIPWRKYITAQTNGSAPVIYYQQFSIRDERWKLIYNPIRMTNRCATAYKTQHNAHFAAGTNKEEIAASSRQIQQVYKTFENPPEYEFYDLKNDPYEFNNLADDAKYKDKKEALIAAFKNWQTETNDPHGDPEKVRQLADEHEKMLNYNYRGDKKFKWGYLDYFNYAGPEK